MNKEELKKIQEELQDLLKPENNVSFRLPRDVFVLMIQFHKRIVDALVEGDWEVGTMTTGGWVYMGDKEIKVLKNNKIREVIKKIEKNWENAAYEIHQTLKEEAELIELHKELDELLKDL